MRGLPAWSPAGRYAIPGPGALKSFLFDGVSDYAVQTNAGVEYFGFNAAAGMGPWTISIWFKTSYSANYQWLWGIYDQSYGTWARLFLGTAASAYSVIYQANPAPFVWDGALGEGGTGYLRQGAGATNPLADGEWHHLCVTCEGVATTGKVSLYIDGALVSAGTQNATVMKADKYQQVSGYAFNNTYLVDGNVSQMTLIKSELSAAAVAALYNGGKVSDPSSSSPYQYFRFGDGLTSFSDTPALVVDHGSSGVDLVGHGPPTIVTDSPQ